ncbi:hypothetical protein BJ508DRAFT_417768 [Ascobolus immersus RN42]|uniref:Uncharacterized protein n=1 Tax=Ascobolus immersus RN42 TaxID=1160509 RepID=A0A3N4HSS0_ASCIM|nr:hypothetical protein BJ508DRAFT_417768 [Ascobolus immersus RN42]
MSSHPRKIALPSTATLLHLQQNIETLSSSLLHPTDPPQVQTQVQQFLDTLFGYALPNVEINGVTPKKLPKEGDEDEENFEDYDYELNEKVMKVQAEVEKETERVTKLRREGPGKVVAGVKTNLESALASDLAALPTFDTEMDDLFDEETPEEKEAWEKVLKSLDLLKDGLPAAASRVMGANDALDVVARPKKI